METYPLDIDPAQVVRWVKAENETSPPTFRITARRSREVRDLPVRGEFHLGDEEREDLSEIATVATLEITPIHASEGWLLRIVVEDEIGPRISAGEITTDGERQIDLGTFYDEFIRPGRGTANIMAEVESPEGRAHLTRLLGAIEKNRHSSEHDPVKHPRSGARGQR
jgi:hypothetical protein